MYLLSRLNMTPLAMLVSLAIVAAFLLIEEIKERRKK